MKNDKDCKEIFALFSYILTDIDCTIVKDSFITKDISKFVPSRSIDSIFVVDSNNHEIDNDINSFHIEKDYDGNDYKLLKKL